MTNLGNSEAHALVFKKLSEHIISKLDVVVN